MVEKTIMGKSYFMPWGVSAVQPAAAIPDTIEEEKKAAPVAPKKPVQAHAPKVTAPPPKPKVIAPPKPLKVLNEKGQWTPKLAFPLLFGSGSSPIIEKWPNLE